MKRSISRSKSKSHNRSRSRTARSKAKLAAKDKKRVARVSRRKNTARALRAVGRRR
jgi:hypothetical protein